MATPHTNEEWQAAIDSLVASGAVPLEEKETGNDSTTTASPKSYPAPATPAELAQYIDHTLLKLDATEAQIDQLCAEAKEHKFKSVCVRLAWVARCVEQLAGSGVVVACVVGFHEGSYATAVKVSEAVSAVRAGAAELDLVLNYDYIKQGAYDAAFFDVQAVRDAADEAASQRKQKAENGTEITLKVILETSQLSDAQIVAAAYVAHAAGADYVKTSTGFNGRGASIRDIQLMKAVVENDDKRTGGNGGNGRNGRKGGKVKASGGVRSKEDALAVIRAGADRIGASSGVAIVQGMTSDAAY